MSVENKGDSKIINSQNLLGSEIVKRYGFPGTDSNFKLKFSMAWKDKVLGIESKDLSSKLLTSLARILLKNTRSSCACIKYGEKRIQIAFNGKEEFYYDKMASQLLKELATETCSLEELERRKEGKMTRAMIRKKNESNTEEKLREVAQKLVKKAVAKDKYFFFPKGKQSSEQLQTIEKLFPRGEFRESFDQFREVIENFCSNRSHSKEEMENFIEKCNEYIASVEKSQLKSLRSNQPGSIYEVLSLSLLNLYDVIFLFNNLNCEEWKKIASTIKNQEDFEVVLAQEKKHVEAKILEANNFNTEIFSGDPPRALITRKPCISCWMLLCACTPQWEMKEKITKRFGGSGFYYKHWEAVSTENVKQEEEKQQIRDNISKLACKLAEGYTVAVEENECLKIGEEEKFNNEIDEITMVRQLDNSWHN